MLRLEAVEKQYVRRGQRITALQCPELTIAAGDYVAIVGPSGSGKTTMLNIVGGLDTASRGHVSVDGQNVIALSEEKLAEMRRNKIGFIFQNFNLLSSFTALENVQVPMVLAGRRNGKKAQQLLASVGLSDRMNHYPSELSGGQQQRVAIARALANDPPLIIGDEMTGDLDTETSYEIMRLLEATNKERGTTIVYVTHDPRMSKFAHRVIQMRDGKLVEETVAAGV